jgi:hypothetical protein
MMRGRVHQDHDVERIAVARGRRWNEAEIEGKHYGFRQKPAQHKQAAFGVVVELVPRHLSGSR